MHTSSLDSLARKHWRVISPPFFSSKKKNEASHSRGWRRSERAEWSERSNKPRSPCTMSVTRIEKKEEIACLPPMCNARAPQKEERPRTVAHERPALVNLRWPQHVSLYMGCHRRIELMWVQEVWGSGLSWQATRSWWCDISLTADWWQHTLTCHRSTWL